AFTKEFNNPKAEGDLAGCKVVAAYPGGSQDVPDSRNRVQKFTDDLRAGGVEIVDSIPKLLEKVDAVLLESVDGRPHLEQARPVIEAHKPLFIDKPMAGSLADAVAIAELAKRNNVPWFSCSSLRFGPKMAAIKSDPKVGEIVGCDAWSPSPTEEHHPDLYWYGIHGVEALYTVMGPGCQSVTRVHTDGADLIVGTWTGGRIGTFRGIRAGKADYGVVAFGKKGVAAQLGFEGYKPLVEEIGRFFKTAKPPIAAEETIELMAFMEAADESKRQGGKAVAIEDVLAKGRKQAEAKIGAR
ncbi:MAG TPA: Gfo/Idh/MocA family oxidoreductase, partial [Tepidisphaeraceae bacterium]